MNTYRFRVLNRWGRTVHIDIEATSFRSAREKFNQEFGNGLNLDRHGSSGTILGVQQVTTIQSTTTGA